jgi:hypothetical protein
MSFQIGQRVAQRENPNGVQGTITNIQTALQGANPPGVGFISLYVPAPNGAGDAVPTPYEQINPLGNIIFVAWDSCAGSRTYAQEDLIAVE